MKLLLTLVALAGLSLDTAAQGTPGPEAERERIATERSQAETRYSAQEIACYQKFAVSDCLKAAKSQRRERLSDLQRQVLTLNEAERKRRASDRVRNIEERNSAQSQQAEAAQRAEAVQRRRDRQDAMTQRAEERVRDPASAQNRTAKARPEARKPVAPVPKVKPARVHDSAEALRRHQLRQQAAQEHRDRVAKRLAEGRKDVTPLPPAP